MGNKLPNVIYIDPDFDEITWEGDDGDHLVTTAASTPTAFCTEAYIRVPVGIEPSDAKVIDGTADARLDIEAGLREDALRDQLRHLADAVIEAADCSDPAYDVRQLAAKLKEQADGS